MNKIPPLDLTQQYQQIEADVSKAVLAVLASGQYIGGPQVQQFETQFAEYIGTRHAVVCNSGTDALYLAMRALDIGPGDEVITTPFTFVATAETISAVGATPVFVDVDPLTFNIDADQVAAAITDKTRAVIPVHLFGYPADMTRLMAVAEAHGLTVIEDCAQATGAQWQGQKVGAIGHVGCFSFFPTKNLGACGDGGAITTNDPELVGRLRSLREHGQRQRYLHDEVGVNSRLDAVQAVILQIKLRHLDTWNQQRHAVAERYHQLLAPVPDVVVPQVATQGRCVWNQYTVRIVHPAAADLQARRDRRDAVRQFLQDQGVSSMVYYPIPLHLQPVYQSLGYREGQLPVAERLACEVLSLPMFPELPPEAQAQVVHALKDAIAL
ncbi:DegT/DnrJ/EryC1/StrS aminotransferase family protein [Geitlerinema sp. PCC 7407]|uniref:DegT/DnrJ/EryC1/StrS family aminotransferase n=1 Tax=Geitlerinema sp. PCC 7407 TaxID=1173025 RepID=UPI00029FD0A2|nr:DegT/DnrJ/EryC1/StrS family aminotransferase [Geitlerinema sp. PCC 7407]AFY66941.1 DegT/DnrJ/EryC1/StrS aminotransferase [Geitlerinema sp. PCC 7407]